MTQTSNEIEKNLRTIFQDILSQKRFDLLDTLIAPEAVFQDGKDRITGCKAIKELVSKRSAAVPDLQYTIDDILINEDKATVRWHAIGKVVKDFAGFKAGQSADYWGISMFQMKDGQIAKNWANSSIEDAPKL